MTNDPVSDDQSGAIEECLEDLDDLIGSLERYPDAVIAKSMRIHLAALLRAMVDNRLCSREDVHEFVLELEQDALGTDET